jgi:DNA-binding NarL/FixJ family response regulator
VGPAGADPRLLTAGGFGGLGRARTPGDDELARVAVPGLPALRAGASGFIGKGAEPDEIVRAVRAVHAGESLLSPVATRSLIEKYVLPVGGGAGSASGESSSEGAPSQAVPPELAHLTDREREVLLLVARGRANIEIATDLVISPHTAKTHVNRIMTKLDAHDRAQLVILAYETGLLAPGA